MVFKKTKFFAMALLSAFLFFQIPPIYANEGSSTGTNDQEEEIKRGYKPSKYRQETGYETIKFGYLGGEFTKIVKTYDYLPCCRRTENDIDGCSAPVICPKYDKI
jgi:hypothetical protein